MEDTLICEKMNLCPIYQRWFEQTRDNRLGLIQFTTGNGYECLALMAVQDPPHEGGVKLTEAFIERLPHKNRTSHYTCSNLKMLNSTLIKVR